MDPKSCVVDQSSILAPRCADRYIELCRSGTYYFDINWREATIWAVWPYQPMTVILVYKRRHNDNDFVTKSKKKHEQK
jgi:hypothetical protein